MKNYVTALDSTYTHSPFLYSIKPKPKPKKTNNFYEPLNTHMFTLTHIKHKHLYKKKKKSSFEKMLSCMTTY